MSTDGFLLTVGKLWLRLLFPNQHQNTSYYEVASKMYNLVLFANLLTRPKYPELSTEKAYRLFHCKYRFKKKNKMIFAILHELTKFGLLIIEFFISSKILFCKFIPFRGPTNVLKFLLRWHILSIFFFQRNHSIILHLGNREICLTMISLF